METHRLETKNRKLLRKNQLLQTPDLLVHKILVGSILNLQCWYHMCVVHNFLTLQPSGDYVYKNNIRIPYAEHLHLDLISPDATDDAKYINFLLSTLFSMEVLVNSTVTGTTRPKLDGIKFNFLKGTLNSSSAFNCILTIFFSSSFASAAMYTARIQHETDASEKYRRLKNLNCFVARKIQNLRKEIKRKAATDKRYEQWPCVGLQSFPNHVGFTLVLFQFSSRLVYFR
jgi:hypothetical protein